MSSWRVFSIFAKTLHFPITHMWSYTILSKSIQNSDYRIILIDRIVDPVMPLVGSLALGYHRRTSVTMMIFKKFLQKDEF